jgi:hypothetical protein
MEESEVKLEIVKVESQDKCTAKKREKFEAFLAEETGQGNAIGSPVSGSNEWMEAIIEWHYEADAQTAAKDKQAAMLVWGRACSALADEKAKKRLAIVCRGRGEGRQDYIRRTVLNGQRLEQYAYSPTTELVGSPWMESWRETEEGIAKGKGVLIDLRRESSTVASEARQMKSRRDADSVVTSAQEEAQVLENGVVREEANGKAVREEASGNMQDTSLNTAREANNRRRARVEAVGEGATDRQDVLRVCTHQTPPRQQSTQVVVVAVVNEADDSWAIAEEVRRNEPWFRREGGGPKNAKASSRKRQSTKSRLEAWNEKVHVWEEVFMLGAIDSVDKVDEFVVSFRAMEKDTKLEIIEELATNISGGIKE